jgi:hypothetical protein
VIASPLSAAPREPWLRTAASLHGHVVVTFTVGELRPGLIEVAVARATDFSGAFVHRNVRLREGVSSRPDPVTGLVRWRTKSTLPARAYYVEVSGFETDGVTDCLPQLRNCLEHWSNQRRVVVR